MKINVTLFIQIINFFITYKVLTLFLFKPILESLKEKRIRKEKLQKSIKEKEQELVNLEQQKRENIITFQKHIKQTFPFISPKQYDKPLEISITKQEIIDTKKLKNKITDWIVSKVPYDY